MDHVAAKVKPNPRTTAPRVVPRSTTRSDSDAKNLKRIHEQSRMTQNRPCSSNWNRSPNTWSAMEKRENRPIEVKMPRKNHTSACAFRPRHSAQSATAYIVKFSASSPDTPARATVGNRESLSPRDAKNLTNRAKKSLPTQRCWTSGMILSTTLNPQNSVQNNKMALRINVCSFMACRRLKCKR